MSDGHRLAFLVTLAMARQASFPDDVQAVYLSLLSDISDESLSRVCRELAKRPRGEYASVMPSVGDIRTEVGHLVWLDACDRDQKQLSAPVDAPVDPERLMQFREDVREALRRRHSFPR